VPVSIVYRNTATFEIRVSHRPTDKRTNRQTDKPTDCYNLLAHAH